MSTTKNKKRGKTREKKDFDKTQNSSVVTMKLKTFSKPKYREDVLKTVNYISQNLTKLCFESYLFANYFILWCFTNKKELPINILDRSFFTTLVRRMTDSTNENDKKEELKECYLSFLECNNSTVGKTNNDYISSFTVNIGLQMSTCSINTIVLNFGKRLIRYCRLKYSLESNKESEDFINKTFICPSESLVDDQKDLFKFMEGKNPCFESNIKSDLPFFIKKSHDILLFMESLPVNTKFKRTFSLIPLKQGYSIDHFAIEKQTGIQNLFQNLPDSTRRELFKDLTFISGIPDESKLLLRKQLDKKNNSYAPTEMFQNKWITENCWDLLFDFKKHQSERRRFNYRLTTDGYSASALYQVPKTEEELEEEEPKTKKQFGLKRKEKKDVGFDDFPNEEELDNFTLKIGIDPGRTFFQSSCDGTKDEKGRSKCKQTSTNEFRHMSKYNHKRKWELNLRKTSPEYQRRLSSIPSLKTGSLSLFGERCKVVVEGSDWLFRFCREKPFQKWNFKTRVYEKKALHKCAKKLVGNSKKEQVIIGFGDWSQSDSSFLRGTAKAPVKKFKEELRKHATVIKIDEYKTSITCSCCLKNDKMKKANGLKSTKDKETGNVTAKKVEIHQVLVCPNCKICWQRDLNASRNIRNLLLCKLQGKDRPSSLCRGNTNKSQPALRVVDKEESVMQTYS
jgi:transposase